MIAVPAALLTPKWAWAIVAAFIAAAVALATMFYAGRLHERSGWESRRAEAIQNAREIERAGAQIAGNAESAHAARLKSQLEDAHVELDLLRAALAEQPRCPVSRRVVGVLDGTGVSATAGAAAKPRGAAAPVAGNADAGAGPPAAEQAAAGTENDTVDVSVVIENCAHNRVHVHEPNALQLEDLQKFYADVRKKYNRK